MEERNLGGQPLDLLMQQWQLENHQLVEASTEQLSHKQIQRARRGRKLTLKMMQKVARAFNVAIWYRLDNEQKEAYFEYGHKHLFNYAKDHDSQFVDPNASLTQSLAAKDS